MPLLWWETGKDSWEGLFHFPAQRASCSPASSEHGLGSAARAAAVPVGRRDLHARGARAVLAQLLPSKPRAATKPQRSHLQVTYPKPSEIVVEERASAFHLISIRTAELSLFGLPGCTP